MNRLILYDLFPPLYLPLLFGHGVEGDFLFHVHKQIGMLDHAFHLSIYTDKQIDL